MITALFSRLADSSGPTVYIAPSNLFKIHGFTITNSIFYGWIISFCVIVILIWVAHRVTVKPKGGLTQFIEMGAEFISNTVENSFEDKKRAKKYIPYFVTLFFFLLISNWSGSLPFANDALTLHGFPLLRPMTGDLNATLAAAVVTMGVVYSSSIREAGSFRKYLGHFFVGSPLNPLYLGLGLLEMFSDITRVISLSLRLFLNIAIGEIVVAVFAYLGHIIAPLSAAPFMIIDLFDGALQAFIFTILTIMYLAISVNHVTQHERDHLTETDVPETIGLELGKNAGGSV
jgi:F-type H+-transporting ATPase subunit a